MGMRKVKNAFSITGQIETNDISLITALGFKSIVCNRSDGENEDQVLLGMIDAAAGPLAADIEKIKQHFLDMPKLGLAYCRARNGSLITWSSGQVAAT